MEGLGKMDPKKGFEHDQSELTSSAQFNRSVVPNSVTPWTAALQAPPSIINSQSLLKLTPIKSVMPSNHLTLRCPLLLLPSIFPSIRVFKCLWKMDPKKGFVHDQLGLTKLKINFNWIKTSYINHSLKIFFVFKLCFVSPCCTMSLSASPISCLIYKIVVSCSD